MTVRESTQPPPLLGPRRSERTRRHLAPSRKNALHPVSHQTAQNTCQEHERHVLVAPLQWRNVWPQHTALSAGLSMPQGHESLTSHALRTVMLFLRRDLQY